MMDIGHDEGLTTVTRVMIAVEYRELTYMSTGFISRLVALCFFTC